MNLKTAAAIGIGILGTEIAWHVLKKALEKPKKIINKKFFEVLLFSDERTGCRDHARSMVACSQGCTVASIKRLTHYLDSSTKTLDVCIYLITCRNITHAIIRAHFRNVSVRVIVDSSMSENTACDEEVMRMKRAGITVVKRQSMTSLMHHKFAIIDKRVIIYGSTNWTMQAFYGNYDGIIITNQSELVGPFSMEFNRMWHEMQCQIPDDQKIEKSKSS